MYHPKDTVAIYLTEFNQQINIKLLTVFSKILFQYHLVSRALTIMTRKSKSIRLLYFNHTPSADGSFVTIKYRFSNAVFHQIGGHKTASRTITVKNTGAEQQISMVVQGYFRRKEYILHLTHDDAYLTRVAQPSASAFAINNYPQLMLHPA